jgi:hypothetical protein
MTWPIQHLTAEDLDAFHSASLSMESRKHLDECVDCRKLVQQDQSLLAMLDALPGFAPRADLADRVLAQVARPIVAPVRRARNRVLARAALVMVGLGASIIWSSLNRALLGSWIDRGAGAIRDLLWEGLATVSQNLSEQPWISGLTSLRAGRLAIGGVVLLLGYAGAMLGLRRLLIQPAPVPGSNW